MSLQNSAYSKLSAMLRVVMCVCMCIYIRVCFFFFSFLCNSLGPDYALR